MVSGYLNKKAIAVEQSYQRTWSMQCALIKLADVEGPVDMLKDRSASQKALENGNFIKTDA